MSEQPKCTCHMTPPATWTRYGGAIEPGSVFEQNPECRACFTPEEIAEWRAGWINVDQAATPTNARWGS